MSEELTGKSSEGKVVAGGSCAIGRVAIIAVSVMVIDWLLAAVTPGSVWYTSHLSWPAKLAAEGWTAVVTAGVMLLWGVPLALLSNAVRKRSIAVGRWITVVVFLTWWVLFAVYAANWNSFRNTGEFLNAYSVRMAIANPHSIWLHGLHMRPWETVLGPIAAVLLAALATLVTVHPSVSLRFAVPQSLRLAGLVLLLLITCGFVAFSTDSSWMIDPETGLYSTVSQRYTRAWAGRSSPVVHGAVQWARWLKGASDPQLWWARTGVFSVAVDDQTERRQQISLREYATGVPQSYRRWNVIFLLVESLRPDQLVCFGGREQTMPHLDRLAARSWCWTRAFTQASHSSYADLCPLTSHYPLRSPAIHFYPENPPYPRVLFYDILHELGYRTAVVSSQDERWGRMANFLQTDGLDHWWHAGNYNGTRYVGTDIGFAAWAQAGKRSGKVDDSVTISEAIRWIEADTDRPFAMYVNLQNSHIPFVIPANYPRKRSPRRLDFTIGFNSYPRERAEDVKNVYADSLTYVDEQIGRLLAALRRQGLSESTAIVVTGDTGHAFYEHGFAAHANEIYNEVMRVPVVIYTPGIEPRTDDRLAEHVDILPSLFDLMGLPQHPSFQGTSLAAAAEGEPDSSVFLMVQTPLAHQVGIVQDQWKFVVDLPTSSWRLYNLELDPEERRNRLADEPAIADKLRRRLLIWCRAQLEYYSDPARMKTEYPPRIK